MAHKRRKNRTHNLRPEAQTKSDVPKSFVVKSGEVGSSVEKLVKDVRRVLEPNTASRLKERKTNRLKDYVAMSAPLGVTHLVVLSQPAASTTSSSSSQKAHVNLRFSRLPRGPTLTFRVLRYSLSRDIIAASRRPKSRGIEFATEPMLILNNFGGEENQVKLMSSMFQNLFPSINVHNMHLSQARRIVLLSYNSSTRTVDFRHYLIKVRPVGVAKNIRKLTTANIPNLASTQDISELLLKGEGEYFDDGASSSYMSSASEGESDVSGDEGRKVVLGEDYVGRGNRRSEKRAIRLTELGPRMELGLMKVEDSLESGHGETLFHEYVTKTKKETEKLKKTHNERNALREKRKKEQEANVAAKEEIKEAKREKKRRKKEEREARRKEGGEGAIEDEGNEDEDESEDEEDSDQDRESGEDEESEGEYEDEVLDDVSAASDSDGESEERA